jgi:hypothetical protein
MSRPALVPALLAAAALAAPARADDPAALAAPPRADDPTARTAPPDDAPVRWREPVLYSLSGMGVGIVALVASRQSDDDPSFGNFTSAFSDGPRRDDDGVLYNFVLHPLWGSETYLRAREANMGLLGSFGFSLGASVTWEYLIESWTEHPSTQDLIFTTGLGWMLGELRYQLKRRMPEDAHGWVDPIHEALEHWGVGVADSESGTPRPRVRLSYRF